MKKRTPEELLRLAQNAEAMSARWLMEANELSEKGKKEAAARLYEKATQWLMKANEYRGW